MFAQLLPSDIAVVVADNAMWESPLCEAEEHAIANAVDKRKREFRAGRNAAKKAINQLDANGDIVILAEQNRRPRWPEGFIGSITHTQGYCAAAVAKQSDYLGIGIDVEPRSPLQPETIAHICTADERQWLDQQLSVSGEDHWGKVFFCVKETLYKVFNPIHDVFLGFQEAEVELSPSDGAFAAQIWQRQEDIRCTYRGRFATDANYIYASMFLAS